MDQLWINYVLDDGYSGHYTGARRASSSRGANTASEARFEDAKTRILITLMIVVLEIAGQMETLKYLLLLEE